MEDGVTGGQSVVRSGRIVLGGHVDSDLGGGMNRGGEGDGCNKDGDRLNRWGGYCSKRNLRDGA